MRNGKRVHLENDESQFNYKLSNARYNVYVCTICYHVMASISNDAICANFGMLSIIHRIIETNLRLNVMAWMLLWWYVMNVIDDGNAHYRVIKFQCKNDEKCIFEIYHAAVMAMSFNNILHRLSLSWTWLTHTLFVFNFFSNRFFSTIITNRTWDIIYTHTQNKLHSSFYVGILYASTIV